MIIKERGEMDKLKYKIDITKFKVTIFMSALGAGIYIASAKDKLMPIFGEYIYYALLALLFVYGSIGYVFNLRTLNKIDAEIGKDEK